KFKVIGRGHVEESGTPFFQIRPAQRILADAVDMVSDQGESSRLQVRAKRPGGIRHYERSDSPGSRDTDRKRGDRKGMPFIIVKAPLKNGDSLLSDRSDMELPRMAGDRYLRKTFHLFIRETFRRL